MSDFETWFIAQHGPRNVELVSDDELRDFIEAGKIAEHEQARRQIWDEKFQAALYAWQARSAK